MPLQVRSCIRASWRLGVASLCGFATTLLLAQTPTLDRLKLALDLERKTDLRGAQAIYQSLVSDPDWGVAAQLSLARVQRWQNLHPQARSNYGAVLSNGQATVGMRDEALIGLAHIDALELRLEDAVQRLDAISTNTAIASQVSELRARVSGTHPTRLGANYGKTHNKGAGSDDSWQLKATHQLDMKNSVALAYSRNSLQQRVEQPNAALDLVEGQWQATWRHQVPLGAAYSLEVVQRRLSLGTRESNVRLQGSWPFATDWRASATLAQSNLRGSTSSSGSVGLSKKVSQGFQVGANLYASEVAATWQHSWMVNANWERGPWLAQWFVSQTVNESPLTNVFVLSQRVRPGLKWRGELKRDKTGSTAFVGLDMHWGQHVTSAAVQASPQATQWWSGFDYAWPNGLKKSSR